MKTKENQQPVNTSPKPTRLEIKYSKDPRRYLEILEKCISDELLSIPYIGDLKPESPNGNSRNYAQKVAQISNPFISFSCKEASLQAHLYDQSGNHIRTLNPILETPSVANSEEDTKLTEITFYIPGTGFVAENYGIDKKIASHLAFTLNSTVMHMHHGNAGETLWPGQLNDICDIIQEFVKEQRQKNPNLKINIAGYSSGGHLATLAAIVLKQLGVVVEQLILFAPLLDVGGELRGLKVDSTTDAPESAHSAKLKPYLPSYFQNHSEGLTEFQHLARQDKTLTPDSINRSVNATFDHNNFTSFNSLRRYSPVWFKKECFQSGNFPKVKIITGENDIFRAEQKVFFEKLRDAGCDATEIVIREPDFGSDHSLFWKHIFPFYFAQSVDDNSNYKAEVVDCPKSIVTNASRQRSSNKPLSSNLNYAIELKDSCAKMLTCALNKLAAHQFNVTPTNPQFDPQNSFEIIVAKTRSVTMKLPQINLISYNSFCNSNPSSAKTSHRNAQSNCPNKLMEEHNNTKNTIQQLGEIMRHIGIMTTKKNKLVGKCSEKCGKSWASRFAETAACKLGETAGVIFATAYAPVVAGYGYFFESKPFVKTYGESANACVEGGGAVAYRLISRFLRILQLGLNALRANEFKAFIEKDVVGGTLFCYLLSISLYWKILDEDIEVLNNNIVSAISLTRNAYNKEDINKLVEKCVQSVEIFFNKKEIILKDLAKAERFGTNETAQKARLSLIKASSNCGRYVNQISELEKLKINYLKLIEQSSQVMRPEPTSINKPAFIVASITILLSIIYILFNNVENFICSPSGPQLSR